MLLAPGLVHLTFETMLGECRTRHSSIWRKGDGAAGWRMYYHQATRVPSGMGKGPITPSASVSSPSGRSRVS
ncbi:hypothetical protein C4B68_39355 [Streptomyces dengpaensis]|uniref:Uncharacterized protein n=1 Tax=Streptomyces dengpaensis TaxID=2049881 RepID=A0ABN5IER6_9ACTN|nr:hypothetical protein C4B68_39355 [Streptomyces dengpaensis]